MIPDKISTDLTHAFRAAAQTIEDENLRKSRQEITAVTLLNKQSGLCALSVQDIPKSGWRVIKQEDLKQLLQGEENSAYQAVLTRVAHVMAHLPLLECVSVPLNNSTLAPCVETFWKMGHNNAKLNNARVILVLAPQNHPELEEPAELVNFYIENRPDHTTQNEMNIVGFVEDVIKAMAQLATKRKVLDAFPSDKLPTLDDEDLLLKLYFFNINENLEVRARNPRLQNLKKGAVVTLLPEPIRAELAKRVLAPDFMQRAQELLTPLPHGCYILEIVQDLEPTKKLAKLNLE